MTTPDPQATPFQPEEAAEAPAFPQASTPGYDEATATPGSTTYGTAYDANQQAAYAAGQQAYGQPAYGQPFAAGAPKQSSGSSPCCWPSSWVPSVFTTSTWATPRRASSSWC